MLLKVIFRPGRRIEEHVSDDTVAVECRSTVTKPTVPARHVNFFLLNVYRLLLNAGKSKSKIKYLFELASSDTLFFALCETFLKDDIANAEIAMPGFSVERSDRDSCIGGGVCLYINESFSFFYYF